MKNFPLLYVIASLALCTQFVAAQNREIHWVGTWAAAPVGQVIGSGDSMPSDATYRNVVHISMGGSLLRVQLSNEFGQQPLTVASVYVGLSGGKDSIRPGSNLQLTFAGRTSDTIPTGGMVLSDPVAMQVPALTDLAVSFYLPEQPLTEMSCHDSTQATNFVARGNSAQSAVLVKSREVESWCFIKGVDIGTHDTSAAAIVTLGDSITDGWRSTRDANSRWPDILASRLQAEPETRHLSVLNEGISGNRLLHDGVGPNAFARFDRDVIGQTGVKYLIILEGINDVGFFVKTQNPADAVSAQDIIFALSQLAVRAHEHGIKVFGATLTPYIGADYFSEHGEQIRKEVNQWIRNSQVFDGTIDFDRVTCDPMRPSALLGAFDSGDHLHPNDAGYRAMGSGVDLSLFY